MIRLGQLSAPLMAPNLFILGTLFSLDPHRFPCKPASQSASNRRRITDIHGPIPILSKLKN